MSCDFEMTSEPLPTFLPSDDLGAPSTLLSGQWPIMCTMPKSSEGLLSQVP